MWICVGVGRFVGIDYTYINNNNNENKRAGSTIWMGSWPPIPGASAENARWVGKWVGGHHVLACLLALLY
jgi:hypothetical protein